MDGAIRGKTTLISSAKRSTCFITPFAVRNDHGADTLSSLSPHQPLFSATFLVRPKRFILLWHLRMQKYVSVVSLPLTESWKEVAVLSKQHGTATTNREPGGWGKSSPAQGDGHGLGAALQVAVCALRVHLWHGPCCSKVTSLLAGSWAGHLTKFKHLTGCFSHDFPETPLGGCPVRWRCPSAPEGRADPRGKHRTLGMTGTSEEQTTF